MQMRQKCTNIIQIVTPAMALLLVFIVGLVGEDDIGALIEHQIFIPIPLFFGVDWQPITNLAKEYISISNCNKWFYTTWGQNATQ